MNKKRQLSSMVLKKKFDRLVEKGYDRRHSTGYPSLDLIIGGFKRADISLIAGRPGSMHKVLAQNIVLSQLQKYHLNLLYFSFKSGKEELYERLLSIISGVNLSQLFSDTQSEEITTKVSSAMAQLSKLRLFTQDGDDYRNLDKLLPLCKKFKMERGIKLMVIDDFQCVGSRTIGGYHQLNIVEKKEKELNQLRKLAQDANIHILILSNLPDYVEFRKGHNKRPKLSDIVNLGLPANIFSNLIFTYRPQYYHLPYWDFDPERETANQIEVIIYKENKLGRPESSLLGLEMGNFRHYPINCVS